MRRVFVLRLLGRSCQVPWKDVCSLLLRHMYVRVINPPDLCRLMALRSVKLCHSSGFKHPGRPVLVLVPVPVPSQNLRTYNTAALFQSGTASLISCGLRGLIDSNATTRGFKSGERNKAIFWCLGGSRRDLFLWRRHNVSGRHCKFNLAAKTVVNATPGYELWFTRAEKSKWEGFVQTGWVILSLQMTTGLLPRESAR